MQRESIEKYGKQKYYIILPWAVKLNKGGSARPLGKHAFASLKSSKKG
jgi:hypothetical protein